jgi:endonuclease/exonuclease/phosphatase family metal-dependent hydrolase
MTGDALMVGAASPAAPRTDLSDLSVMTWNVCAGKQLDYLFAPKGTVGRCHLDQSTKLSDHQPLTVKVVPAR